MGGKGKWGGEVERWRWAEVAGGGRLVVGGWQVVVGGGRVVGGGCRWAAVGGAGGARGEWQVLLEHVALSRLTTTKNDLLGAVAKEHAGPRPTEAATCSSLVKQ